MNNSDMPAGPYIDHQVHEHCGFDGNSGPYVTEHNIGYCGLTKREHFAGLAMQGMLASAEYGVSSEGMMAEWAVSQADALLKALDGDIES